MVIDDRLEKKRKASREWARRDRLEHPKKHRDTHNKSRKSFRGYLVEKYYAITRRCRGFEKNKAHIYSGLSFVSKDVFLDWSLNSEQYKSLYDKYVLSNYEQKLAPSIDRIDSSIGYVIGNMQFITNSENSRRGANSRWNNELQ